MPSDGRAEHRDAAPPSAPCARPTGCERGCRGRDGRCPASARRTGTGRPAPSDRAGSADTGAIQGASTAHSDQNTMIAAPIWRPAMRRGPPRRASACARTAEPNRDCDASTAIAVGHGLAGLPSYRDPRVERAIAEVADDLREHGHAHGARACPPRRARCPCRAPPPASCGRSPDRRTPSRPRRGRRRDS